MYPYILVAHQLSKVDQRFPLRVETACKLAFVELAEEDDFFECEDIDGAVVETQDPRACFDDSLLTVQVFGVPRDTKREQLLTRALCRRILPLIPSEYRNHLGIALDVSAQSRDSMLREEYIRDAIEFADHHFNMHLPEDREL